MAGKELNKIPFIEFHKRLAVNQLQRHLRLLDKTTENAAAVSNNNEQLLNTLQRIDWDHYRARLQNGLNKAVAECVNGIQAMWDYTNNNRYGSQLVDAKRALLQLSTELQQRCAKLQQHLTRIDTAAIKAKMGTPTMLRNPTLSPCEDANVITAHKLLCQDRINGTKRAVTTIENATMAQEDPFRSAERTQVGAGVAEITLPKSNFQQNVHNVECTTISRANSGTTHLN